VGTIERPVCLLQRRESEIRRILSMAVVHILVFSVFSTCTSPVRGWSGAPLSLHQLMARDALEGLEWIGEKIGIAQVSIYANLVDQQHPHCVDSCHRVKLFQKIFSEAYGGPLCRFPGAEDCAVEFIKMARDRYVAGNTGEADKYLGYAIHYVQDALCPPHVFPFKEDGMSAHSSFELYTDKAYRERGVWRSRVRHAPPTYFSTADHLRDEIFRAALWVHDIDCSFVAQDGNPYRSTRGVYERISEITPSPVVLAGAVYYIRDWRMTDDDIGRIVERAASLVKGAAIWAVCQTVHIHSIDNRNRGDDPSKQTDLSASIMISYTRGGRSHSEVKVTPCWVQVDRNSKVTLSVASNPNGWSFSGWWDDYAAHGQRITETFTFDVGTSDHRVAAFFFFGCSLHVRAYPNSQHWPDNVGSDLNANVEVSYQTPEGSYVTEVKTTPFVVYCYGGSKARVAVSTPYPSGHTWDLNSKWDNYAQGYGTSGQASMEVDMDRDRTAVAYFSSGTLKVANVQSAGDSRRCLIATATYGSELSPEVQFLRSFRDNMVLSTFAGGSFMQAFNAWYYSFSPSVAQSISRHPRAVALARVTLHPLLGILHLSSQACSLSSNSEIAVIIAGLIASSLIGVAYVFPAMIAIEWSFERKRCCWPNCRYLVLIRKQTLFRERQNTGYGLLAL